MRLSTYNVENLFARAQALQDPGGQPQVLAAQAEVNQIIAQPAYSTGDKARIVALLDQLGLLHGDDGPYAVLRQNRGHLVSRAGGTVTVTAGHTSAVSSTACCRRKATHGRCWRRCWNPTILKGSRSSFR